MRKLLFLSLCTSAFLSSVVQPSAQAQMTTVEAMTGSNACVQAANFPKPFGEWDLKGNAKLPAYCDCYMSKFGARAAKKAVNMSIDPSKSARKKREESHEEEMAMRNSCRKDLGLLTAVDATK